MTTSGGFDVTQLNAFKNAHLDWCAANSIDPKSELGEDAGAYLVQAFSIGSRTADEMIVALDRFAEERARHVQLGSPAIPSSND